MALQVMLRQDLIIETAFNTQVNGSMSGSDYFVLCILIDLTRVRFIFLDSWLKHDNCYRTNSFKHQKKYFILDLQN